MDEWGIFDLDILFPIYMWVMGTDVTIVFMIGNVTILLNPVLKLQFFTLLLLSVHFEIMFVYFGSLRSFVNWVWSSVNFLI